MMDIDAISVVYDGAFSREIAVGAVEEHFSDDPMYQGLSYEQQEWFARTAAPMLVNEGLETAAAIARERSGVMSQADQVIQAAEALTFGAAVITEEKGKD